MRCRTVVLVLAVVTIVPPGPQARAALDEWAIGLKSGTLGVGGELMTPLVERVNLRGGVQWLDVNFDAKISDINYDVDLDYLNSVLLFDWYPWDTSFRISGGVVFNGSDVRVDATSNMPIRIGTMYFTPSEYGSIRGTADYPDIVPYVGIGFGNPFLHGGRWGFSADAGVAFIGRADVHLHATGSFADNPILLENLAREEQDIEDYLDDYRFYPVLSLTLYYRF